MTRVFAVYVMFAATASAATCQPRITRADAIRIAKQQIAQHWGAERVRYFGPYTAELHDCSWAIRIVSPVRDARRYLFIAVDAQTGRSQYDAQGAASSSLNAREQQR